MSQAKKSLDSRQKDVNLATKKARTDARKSKNVERNQFQAAANKELVKAAGIIPMRDARGRLKRNSKLARILERTESRPEPQLDKEGGFLYDETYTPPKRAKKAAA